MLIKSCLDLNNSPDSQGAGMLNLKALFQGDSVEKNEVESISGNRDDLLESLVMLLIIFFLLDSKI